jgi:hypothetical protein
VIFGESNYGYIYIPFINPGFTLAMTIKKESETYFKQYGKEPELIFMENHGIIATHDDADEAIRIHQEANEMIMGYFNVTPYPKAETTAAGNCIISQTEFMRQFILRFRADEAFFEKTILYPDQLVYQGRHFGDDITVDVKTGIIKYSMDPNVAQTIEEVLIGVVYIISEINRLGLALQLLDDEGVNFIKNWEGEKYRASLNK